MRPNQEKKQNDQRLYFFLDTISAWAILHFQILKRYNFEIIRNKTFILSFEIKLCKDEIHLPPIPQITQIYVLLYFYRPCFSARDNIYVTLETKRQHYSRNFLSIIHNVWRVVNKGSKHWNAQIKTIYLHICKETIVLVLLTPICSLFHLSNSQSSTFNLLLDNQQNYNLY